MKLCFRCCTYKPLDEFYGGSPRGHAGRQTYCKECHKAYQKEWHKKHPGRATAYGKKWRKENYAQHRATENAYFRNHKDYTLAKTNRRRARKENSPVIEKIDRQYIFSRDRMICQLCFKKVLRKDAALDHVIPLSKGGAHTEQNIQLVHKKCNVIKGNSSVTQQMRLFG